MSRRDYGRYDDDYDSDIYRRPRREKQYDELEVDATRSRNPEARRGGPETVVKERETVVSDRRTERGPRQPDFLRDDYGRSSNAGPLVVREERTVREEDDTYSRAPTRRRSLESVRSRPAERVEKEEIRIRETERDREPPYPRSERDFVENEEIVFRDRERERSRPPPAPRERTDEQIDIKIRRQDNGPPPPPPRSEAPSRSDYRERDVEEIRFRRGGGDRPPPREVVEREQVRFTETRSPPSRTEPPRGRDREVVREEIDIREERSAPPPRRERSQSRGQLIGRKREEWIVRRPRSPSPPPPPAPRDYEKEEIIIRRKERTPSPEPLPPPREPSPEPIPLPPIEPIIRPPIIQEVITHHRHIDHGFERVRSLTPPPPPSPPSPPREENLEIEIRRKGMRNGKFYDEDIIFEEDRKERKAPQMAVRERERERDVSREVTTRRRSVSTSTAARPRRSPSRERRRGYDDVVGAEADYYNRKVVGGRAYPGEAWNGATKKWELVDVPPGTERVRMDGIGGASQEITWARYNGERRGKFHAPGENRVYEGEWGNGGLPEPRRGGGGFGGESKTVREKLWTEVSKDLVIKEAVEEAGYEFEETEEFFYVMEYLRYEDVLRLVELTEDIRRERRERIREIQWEREELERAPKMLMPAPPPPPTRNKYDERIYEREYIFDRDGRRYR